MIEGTLRTIIFSLLIIGVIAGTYNIFYQKNDQAEKEYQIKIAIQKALESAYFEGQRDAINGDVRIKLNEDSVYVWTKSPWNDGTLPIYFPDKSDSKK